MAQFKSRPLPDELTAALRAGVRDVPAAVVQQQPDPPQSQRQGEGEGRGARAPRTVQINFNATEDLARIVAQEAKKAGSTRRFIAKLMKDAGFAIPDADLYPADNRRRWVE